MRTKNPRLFEINTALWLSELSHADGREVTLGDVPPHVWDGFRDLGFDYIWLMGVWRRSPAGLEAFRKDPAFLSVQAEMVAALPGYRDSNLIGSPYSVRAYEPDPLFGDWQGIDAAREELHKRRMGLVLDFVPNHTAPDHTWVFERPDFYLTGGEENYSRNPDLFHRIERGDNVLSVAKGKDPYFPPWPDTAQLNYFNPHMRAALLEELKKIAAHCDGVRCDMAMLVLNDIFRNNWGWLNPGCNLSEEEFWATARKALPGLIFIAEAYWDTEWRLQELGFDFVYDKRLYDRLLSGSAADIYAHLRADTGFQRKLLRFIENHDEPRSAGLFGRQRLQAAIVLFSTLPGMKLYHHGQ
ncbi:MAG: alpha-amylase family glycosyl hydrolase, partial [Thermodesulfovibrionales bacterium]